MKKFAVVFVVMAILTGCAQPTKFTDQAMRTYDSNTNYVIEDVSDGFILSVDYSRYQFIPESSAVAIRISCPSSIPFSLT